MSATLSMLRGALISPPVAPDLLAPVRQSTRAWPWLCDSLGHVNNVRYLDVAQDGRIWWLAQMGLLRSVLRGRVAFLVTGMNGLYRRPIARMAPFVVETQLVAFDARFVCYRQTFISVSDTVGAGARDSGTQQIAARFLCRGQLRDTRGPLEPAKFMRRHGFAVPSLPLPSTDVSSWLAAQEASLAEVREQDRTAL